MSIEAIIGYSFRNKRVLEEALTHPSCAEVRGGAPFSYQRLEFLGDAVLGLVVAELLFALFPEENEGSLAKRHAALVRSEALADVARRLGVGPYIRMGGNGQDAARDLNSNLEDVCEALIGAMYLDGGFDVARQFVLAHWEPLARALGEPPKDAKTSLQEWAQARGLPLPQYQVLETTGPAHSPEFTIAASVEGAEPSVAKASSKRQAEQLAARALMERLEE
jgi:ribonuclease-3